MQLTIDINDSVADKVLYLLKSLKSDVKILSKSDSNSLDIEAISEDDSDFVHIIKGREERNKNPQNYGTIEEVNLYRKCQ